MSDARTLTFTKTEQSPVNAFDLYPPYGSALSAENFAAFKVAYPLERTVEIVGDSMIVKLAFGRHTLVEEMGADPDFLAMRALKQVWIEANFIVETVGFIHIRDLI